MLMAGLLNRLRNAISPDEGKVKFDLRSLAIAAENLSVKIRPGLTSLKIAG
jgi:hypothetical protein